MRYLPLVLGLGAAALCARLGMWQLNRLEERQALNAEVRAAMTDPPFDLADRPVGPDDRYRRVTAAGTFEFGESVVEMLRPRNGAPGVYLFTPLRLADGRRVLVNRGWVYSPDARTLPAGGLAEPAEARVEGILVPPRNDGPAVRPDTLGADVLPLLLRRTVAPPGAPDGLTVLDLPALDDGPHLSYAVQWFAFGLIAFGGGILLAVRGGVRG